MRSYLEKTHHKQGAGAVAQCVGPEFKSQYFKKILKTAWNIKEKKRSPMNYNVKTVTKKKMEETMNITYQTSSSPFKDHSCTQS
jgi:hypothetical protein